MSYTGVVATPVGRTSEADSTNSARFGMWMPESMLHRLFAEASANGMSAATYVRFVLSRHFSGLDRSRAA